MSAISPKHKYLKIYSVSFQGFKYAYQFNEEKITISRVIGIETTEHTRATAKSIGTCTSRFACSMYSSIFIIEYQLNISIFRSTFQYRILFIHRPLQRKIDSFLIQIGLLTFQSRWTLIASTHQ